MTKPRLILLCDYGLDDAVATVYLLNRKEMFDGIDILAVAGNTPASHCHNNAKILLSNFFENQTIPNDIRLITTSSITQNAALVESVHGKDGMGDMLTLTPCVVTELSFDNWIKEIITGNPPITLVSLGPCTVTKKILEHITPAAFLLMGGLTSAKPNFNGYEFNHYLDKEAFEFCAGQSNAVVATLDTCRHPCFNQVGKHKKGDTLLTRLINRTIDIKTLRHPDNCYIYDYITVHYLTHPDCFEVVRRKGQGVTLNQLELIDESGLEI